MEENNDRFLIRNLFTKKSVIKLAKRIRNNYSAFDEKGFIRTINSKLDLLSFGERNKLIQDALIEYLPNKFEDVVKILVSSLGKKLKADYLGGGNYDFIEISPPYVIERLGMDNFDLSMEALREMTMRLSSEGAIRKFIEKYPEKSMRLLNRWAKDKNVHVRRLVSEGTRPRLPLASPIKMFIKDPRPIIPLLDKLKDDSDLYVRRSVANNLNDISKDNPEIVVDTLRKWKKNASRERLWVIRHSLRTLYKRGNKDALKLMGFFKPEVSDIVLSLSENSIKIGKHIELTVTITPFKDQNLMIDYVIHYMKANGKNSPKVFKLSVKKAKKGQNLIMNKKISFKQMTTRKHYKGKHFIELIVNGFKFQKEEFMLK